MSDQIDVNQLSNALQQKVDLPSGKSQADIDYVVEWQVPTADNNYTWYRLYKSGWVEQGGIIPSSTGTSGTIALLVTMLDTNYQWQASVSNTSANNFFVLDMTINRTTSSIPWVKSDTRVAGCWEVKGMSAQS